MKNGRLHAALLLGLTSFACGDDESTEPLGDAGVFLGDLGSEDAGFFVDAGPTDATMGDAEPMDVAVVDMSLFLDVGPMAPDAGSSGPDVGIGGSDGGTLGPDAGAASDGGMSTDAGSGLTCDPTFGSTGSTCGGNPAGSWRFAEVCGANVVDLIIQTQCPTATSSNVVRTSTGTLTLTSTGSYTIAADDRVSADLFVPTACAAQTGGCSGLGLAFLQLGGVGTCTQGTNGCDCQVTFGQTTNESGTYTTSAGVLTLGSYTFDYCVGSAPTRLDLRESQTGSVYVLEP